MGIKWLFSDLSCPKPSYINVGDKVQVNINTDSFRQLNKEFGGWNDEMEKVCTYHLFSFITWNIIFIFYRLVLSKYFHNQLCFMWNSYEKSYTWISCGALCEFHMSCNCLRCMLYVFFPTVDCWRNWSGPESDSRQPAECGVWRWKTVGHLQTGLYEGDILQIYL